MKQPKYVTHTCPHCHSTMLYLYRQRAGTDDWEWVLYCVRCKREQQVPEDECLLGEDEPAD